MAGSEGSPHDVWCKDEVILDAEDPSATGDWVELGDGASCQSLARIKHGAFEFPIRNQCDRYIRLAFCSIKETSVEPLIADLERVSEKM